MNFDAPHIEYATISPMLVVFGLAIVGVLVEAFAPRGFRYVAQTVLAIVGLSAAFAATVWVATDLESAALDAIQYLEGGPCVHSVQQGSVVTDSAADPVDERAWQTFAAATARAGVGSTLSIPHRASIARAAIAC